MSSVLYTNFDFKKKNTKNNSHNVNLALKLMQQKNMIIQQKKNQIGKLHNGLKHEEENKHQNEELIHSLENNNSSILIDDKFITFF